MVERVIVTGAQGLLGRHVVASFLENGATVLGIGRSPRFDRRYTHTLEWRGDLVAAPLPRYLLKLVNNRRYAYVSVDLANADAMVPALDQFQPEAIVHAAAALRDEQWAQLSHSNVQAVIGLVEALDRHRTHQGKPRLVVVSSGSVYGSIGTHTRPLQEEDPCVPTDMYAVSKRASEDIARVLAAERDLTLIVARVFNLIGPGLQHRHLTGSLAGQIAAIELGYVDPRIEVGPLNTTRDFIDVRDAAAGLVTVTERGRNNAVYNVASGVETPVNRILDELLGLSDIGANVEIHRRPARPADTARSVADISKLVALGYESSVSLSESLRDMLDYYLIDVVGSTR